MKNILILALCAIYFNNCGVIGNTKEDTSSRNLAIAGLALLSQGSQVSTINFRLDSGSMKSVGCTSAVSNSSVIVSGGTKMQLNDARFYAYDVKLITADGSKTDFKLTTDGVFQNSFSSGGKTYTLGLIDFADKANNCANGAVPSAETNLKLVGTSVSGNYTGIEFTMGVPAEFNNQDNTTLAAPLNSTAMYWSWNSGYKFMKVEFMHEDATDSNKINYWHMGSSSCASNVCARINRPTITLKKSTGNINFSTDVIALDLQQLLDGTNTNSGNGGKKIACHSGPQTGGDCSTIGTNVGVNSTDGTSLTTQKAFSIK
ncbi:MAG: metallo-mystery pair system four-Cys motif protein [Leptospiraceae bacterium]|nr:metallo-mystery pair system four-Cys motif protein [Leptospiraceae bacterium]